MKKQKYLKFILFTSLFWVISFSAQNAFADVVSSTPTYAPPTINDISSFTGLSKGVGDKPVLHVLENVLKFVTGIIAVIAMIMIVVSGIMYIVSAGDDKRVETAKTMLTYSIVGLIVALLGYVIVSSIGHMLGI